MGVPFKGALFELTKWPPPPLSADFKCFAVAVAVAVAVVVVVECCELGSSETFLAGSPPVITLLSGTGKGNGGVKSTLLASRDIVAAHNLKDLQHFFQSMSAKVEVFRVSQ